MRTCPNCGSDFVEYQGIQDGGGMFGASVCDHFFCYDCDTEFEGNCIEDDGWMQDFHDEIVDIERGVSEDE